MKITDDDLKEIEALNAEDSVNNTEDMINKWAEAGRRIEAKTANYQKKSVEKERSDKSRLTYILLGIFFGGLGVHNFYIGRTGIGITQMLLTLFTSWLIVPIVAIWIWVIVEICIINTDKSGARLS